MAGVDSEGRRVLEMDSLLLRGLVVGPLRRVRASDFSVRLYPSDAGQSGWWQEPEAGNDTAQEAFTIKPETPL